MKYTTASEALPDLCEQVLHGARLGSRVGQTSEVLFADIALTEPWKREILTPGRKANIVAQIAETLWVLAGRDDVEWLSAYLPRAKDFSDDGLTWRGAYGPRIRSWFGAWDKKHVDQLREVVTLLKADPETRRAVISLWDPAADYVSSKDIPCNNWLHFINRDGVLNLHVATRSNDLMWGWSGINAFEWSALLELVASMTGAQVGELHFSITSLHLYEQHWAKAARIVKGGSGEESQLTLLDSPRTAVTDIDDLDRQLDALFTYERALREGRVTNLYDITDPLLLSWASVLSWHWTKDERFLKPLEGTRLAAATREMPSKPLSPFVEWASNLHAEKHAVYGDSWKRRGEQVGIQANIARKVDRLGKAGAGDNELDTTTDLLVYLVKYALWINNPSTTDGDGHVADVRKMLAGLEDTTGTQPRADLLETALTTGFEQLLDDPKGWIDVMIEYAFTLALLRYNEVHAAPTGLGQSIADRNATRRWNPEA